METATIATALNRAMGCFLTLDSLEKSILSVMPHRGPPILGRSTIPAVF
jgi:hypothetical protein